MNVIEEKSKDTYLFFHTKMKYKVEEISFPFTQYSIVDTDSIAEKNTLEEKVDMIQTSCDLLLQNQKILFSLLQYEYMEAINDMPDLSEFIVQKESV